MTKLETMLNDALCSTLSCRDCERLRNGGTCKPCNIGDQFNRATKAYEDHKSTGNVANNKEKKT